MLCIKPDSTDPFFNLALEEFLLKNRKEDYLILYVNAPSVVIGKHQIAHRESDTEFVTNNNIPVIRRISGGGAVYHDAGNLNFTFISQSRKGSQVDFRKYTEPVIGFLATLGVESKFEGKNDLKVNGFKISGNAEHVHRERVLHHGTLLFDADTEVLGRTIRNDISCYSTRAVRSNPSPVRNLKQHLPGIINMEQFRISMFDYFISRPGNDAIKLTDDEKLGTESLAASKFRTWEWNYAYGPEYHFNNSFIFNGKKNSVRIFVKDGIIKECDIEGSAEMKDTGNRLIGCRHMPEDINEIFRNENLSLTGSEVFNFF